MATIDQLQKTDAKPGAEDVSLDRIMQQGHELGAAAQDALKTFRPVVEQALKDKPLTTLLAASAIGFILAALVKRS